MREIALHATHIQHCILNTSERDTRDESIDVALNSLGEAYGKRIFKSHAERVAFLFDRYQQLTSLLPAAPKKAARKRKTAADDADN